MFVVLCQISTYVSWTLSSFHICFLNLIKHFPKSYQALFFICLLSPKLLKYFHERKMLKIFLFSGLLWITCVFPSVWYLFQTFPGFLSHKTRASPWTQLGPLTIKARAFLLSSFSSFYYSFTLYDVKCYINSYIIVWKMSMFVYIEYFYSIYKWMITNKFYFYT